MGGHVSKVPNADIRANVQGLLLDTRSDKLVLGRTSFMAWTVTRIQPTQISTGDVMPGFNLRQDGHSPSVTFVFENEQKAREGQKLLDQLLDMSAAIVHLGAR